MRRILLLAVLFLGFTAAATAATAAPDEAASFDGKRARTYRAAAGRPLAAASQASPDAAISRFLESRGVGASTLRSLKPVDRAGASRGGITHVRMEQEVEGLRVADAYVKASFNERGELVHLIQNLATVPESGLALAPARVDERQALRAALRNLYPELEEDPGLAGRQGNVTTFAKGSFFYDAPRVERVAIAMRSGALRTGFLVETWSRRGNLLHETLVGGDGRILKVELRTNADSYNVFVEDPLKGAQTVVSGPGAGNAESPAGWLFAGPQSSIQISGNNAHAYLDAIANNKPDTGGTAVLDGNFLTAVNLAQDPSTANNRNVGVQNLFYLNNVIHDILYRAGFTEAAGNFQEDNFGLGGSGGDPVNAEAQDGSSLDNADFSTPRDGRPPRMQMYLWSSAAPDHEVVVDAPGSIAGSYGARGAVFGPALTTTGIAGGVVLAVDGTVPANDGCEAIQNSVSGMIALVDRGTCNFTVKVANAQAAGAIGVIVANNVAGLPFTMGGTDHKIKIPSVMVSQADGATLRSAAGVHATLRKLAVPGPQIDGDLDADVVFHEYGHGLTWRMIGGMSGPLAGAIGEGMSDVLAVILNGDDVVGEYAGSNPLGIRSAPYTNYPRTYGDIAGTEVHLDGEVYGAIGWRLWEIFQREGLSRDLLLHYLVDGMNFTPATPAFEDMRDGVLQSAAGSGHECLIWEAFAQYGVGVGATGTATRSGTVTITESFTKPAACP